MTLNPKQFRSVYHGTGESNWDSISREGLRPSPSSDPYFQATVSDSKSQARGFAEGYGSWNGTEDKGIVVHARIPVQEFHEYVGPGQGIPTVYPLRRTVPPEYLRRIDRKPGR